MTKRLFITGLLLTLAAAACQPQEPPAPGGAEAPAAPAQAKEAPPAAPAQAKETPPAAPAKEKSPPPPESASKPDETVAVVSQEGIQTHSSPAQQSSPAPAAPAPSAAPSGNNKRLAEDGIHDPAGPAITLLQEPATALAKLPMDNRGLVNWVESLQQGKINPRATLDGKESMTTFDLDLVMTDTKNMPHVRFPHIAHTQWLACENCHPAIFLPQAGANPIDMNAIFKQKYCGACHDKVAFPLVACPRCHSITHEGSPPQWW